jgi:hypothetical protein
MTHQFSLFIELYTLISLFIEDTPKLVYLQKGTPGL